MWHIFTMDDGIEASYKTLAECRTHFGTLSLNRGVYRCTYEYNGNCRTYYIMQEAAMIRGGWEYKFDQKGSE